MNRRIGGFLLALMLLFSLSGCNTLRALEEIRNQGGSSQPSPDSIPKSPQRPTPKPTTPAPSTGGETLNSPEEREPDPIEEIMLGRLQDEITQSGSMAGLAFAGYVDSGSSESDLREYLEWNDLGMEYPFLLTADILMAEGQELYAVVPPNENGTVTVYASDMTEECEYVDDTSAPLYEGLPGQPVVVLCNFSEIYSNVLITVTDGRGTVEFRPSISLKDGHLTQEPGVYDFSIYLYEPSEFDISSAMDLLLMFDEVQQAMQQGMKLMYTGTFIQIEGENALLFALGTDHEENFVSEIFYAVSENYIFVYDPVYDQWDILGP